MPRFREQGVGLGSSLDRSRFDPSRPVRQPQLGDAAEQVREADLEGLSSRLKIICIGLIKISSFNNRNSFIKVRCLCLLNGPLKAVLNHFNLETNVSWA